ncbi:exosortase O [Spartinivicinus poritis]|uniref:Exosortase O n=1 Tax=Spartinivicinus poritis TaxID=2994640 RepID=A0ABT5U6B4_9GAMM|nr:exosortase O [Spartinivicinus sp. A2-2]MDE1461905.1 exosortase O [Spartinivicinus sp. A2-2]
MMMQASLNKQCISTSCRQVEQQLVENPLVTAVRWNAAFIFSQLLVVISLIYLFKPTLLWVWKQIQTAENSFHIIGVGLLVGLAIHSVVSKKLLLTLSFQIKKLPLVVFTVGCLIFLLNERLTGIHIFSATLMLITLYGFLGLYVKATSWAKAFLPFALLILLLPFEGYLDIYLGFPLRLFSAEMAKHFLSSFGVIALTRESVILIENKAAIVDLSCSGLKGLWAGLIFYIFLTWIESKKLSLRWLISLMLFICCLVGFNIFRIISLVALDLVLNLPQLANYAHTMLGVLGFVFSCLFGWLLMRLQSGNIQISPKQESMNTNPPNLSLISVGFIKRDCYGLVLLFIIITGSIFLYEPLPKQQSITNKSIELPVDFNGKEVAFLPIEEKFFKRNSASAVKYQFEWSGHQGSLIFVYSHYWKSQHDPRNCYLSQNITVDYEKILSLSAEYDSKPVEIKYLHLNGGQNSGFYWFQSPTKQTADYSSRVFSGWLTPSEPWVMVSVAWEGELSALATEKFVGKVYSHIKSQF